MPFVPAPTSDIATRRVGQDPTVGVEESYRKRVPCRVVVVEAYADLLEVVGTCMRRASRAAWTAGNNIAIRTAMIAITTNNSISVQPNDADRWLKSYSIQVLRDCSDSCGPCEFGCEHLIMNRTDLDGEVPSAQGAAPYGCL